MKSNNQPYKQIWEAIADGIKEDIFNGYYKLGEPLKEIVLAKKYESSKTPVKEALRYLEGIGFVEIISYKGARVKNMNKGEVLSLYNILGALEGLAARGATPNLNKKHYEKLDKYAGLLETYFQENEPAKYEKTNLVFHSIIFEDLDDTKLTELFNQIREQLQRYRPVTRRYMDRFQEVVSDHRKLIEAFVQEDAEKAEGVIRRHYERSGEIIVGLLESENTF